MNVIDFIVSNWLLILQVYFIIDTLILMSIWIWKEMHYQYHILYFVIPFTGIPTLIWSWRHGGVRALFEDVDGERS